MPPWLRLAWQHPERLSEHVAAYAALASDEAGAALDDAWRRARQQLLVAAGLAVAATLGGTALLLWAALPALPEGRAVWLMAVPLVPLLGAAWAWQRRPPPAQAPPFAGLRAQLALDRAAWRAAQAPREAR